LKIFMALRNCGAIRVFRVSLQLVAGSL